MIVKNLVQATEQKDFSKELRKAIDEATCKMQESGVIGATNCIPLKEQRTITTANNKAVDVWDLESALYNTSILKNAGAQYIYGLKQATQVPLCSKLAATWAVEDGVGEADINATMSETTIKPHRLTTFLNVSKQLLMQTTNIETLLSEMLATAINEQIEKTIFSKIQQTNAPKAMLIDTPTTITSYSDICDLEDSVSDSLSSTYILSKSAKKVLRQMKKEADGNVYVMENGAIDGTKTITSSNMEKDYLIYGDFSKLKICVWGEGIDLTVDPITKAKEGNVRLIINFYCDYFISNGSSYAIAKI